MENNLEGAKGVETRQPKLRVQYIMKRRDVVRIP